MNNILKLTRSIVIAVAVVLPFLLASCGNNDDDNVVIICPPAPTYVPTNLEVMDKDGTTQEIYGYEYNHKYLLTKYSYKGKDKDNKWVSSVIAFNYNEKGKLISFSIDDGELIEIEYDEDGNLVNSDVNQDDKFIFTLDSKGYPVKAYNDFTKVTITYEYDANRNIIKQVSVDESDKDNPITNTIATIYTNTFSPFAFLKIPTWYTLDNANLLLTTGLRMPLKETYTRPNEVEEIEYKVEEELENFPTKIHCTTTLTNSEGNTEVSVAIYKVEYKEIK